MPFVSMKSDNTKRDVQVCEIQHIAGGSLIWQEPANSEAHQNEKNIQRAHNQRRNEDMDQQWRGEKSDGISSQRHHQERVERKDI